MQVWGYCYPNFRVLETEVCTSLVFQHFERHQLIKIFLVPSLEVSIGIDEPGCRQKAREKPGFFWSVRHFPVSEL